MSRMSAKRETRWPRNIVWKRDVRMIIQPNIKVGMYDKLGQDNNLYVLPRTGSACAIVPRGITSQEPGRFYGYVGFLKSFIAKRCKQNNGIFMVILRGVYDIITAETILCMKKEFSHIKLICIEPYEGYFLKLASKIRERYLQIISAADEVHRYDEENIAGEAEQFALAHVDALLFIQSEETNAVWQKLLDTIWSDLRKSNGYRYTITQFWIVNMEWIIHKEYNDAAMHNCLY